MFLGFSRKYSFNFFAFYYDRIKLLRLNGYCDKYNVAVSATVSKRQTCFVRDSI